MARFSLGRSATAAVLTVAAVAWVLYLALKDHDQLLLWFGLIGPLAGLFGVFFSVYHLRPDEESAPPRTPPESTIDRATQKASIKSLFNRGDVFQILVQQPAPDPKNDRRFPVWLTVGIVVSWVVTGILVGAAIGPDLRLRHNASSGAVPPQNLPIDPGMSQPTPAPGAAVTPPVGHPCVKPCRRIQAKVGTSVDADPGGGDGTPDLRLVDADNTLPTNGAGIIPVEPGPLDARLCPANTNSYSKVAIATPPIAMCLVTSAGQRIMFIRFHTDEVDDLVLAEP
ncbi:hypothetical protein [Nocardia sp. NPDC052566]|uniref:hypothetical protein n=1 Tax=Nocardia sp. NPDC052566 TaxID=3364330 RepID=UPI0037C5CD0C